MMVEMLFGLGIVGIPFGLVVFIVGQLFNIFLSLLVPMFTLSDLPT